MTIYAWAIRQVLGMNDMTFSEELTHYDTACKAVAAANSVDEIKDICEKAEAMRTYARQAKNKQLEIDASEIRFRAERRLGELMEAQRQIVGLAPAGRPKEIGSEPDPIIKPLTQAEAGIDKHLADRARKYAAIPSDEFEAFLAGRRQPIDSENKRVTALEAVIWSLFLFFFVALALVVLKAIR